MDQELPVGGPQGENETYLAKLAGLDVELPPEGPQGRNAKYLAYIIEHGIGGGLPPVTGSGKALVSVDGEWVEQDGFPYAESAFEPITWDGDTTGKEMITEVGTPYFVQLSSEAPEDPNDLIGGGFKVYSYLDYREYVFQIGENCVSQLFPNLYGIKPEGAHELSIIIAISDVEVDGVVFKKGIWFSYVPDRDYTSALTPPSTVHTIDPKYLPSTIPTTEDVQDMINTAIGNVDTLLGSGVIA